jgi:hypothetical protein
MTKNTASGCIYLVYDNLYDSKEKTLEAGLVWIMQQAYCAMNL